MEKILAIGSVVKVNMKNLEKPIMIIGRFMKSSKEPESKMYDYLGVVYPYGFVGNDNLILFDEEGIEQILYEGYINQDELDLSDNLLNELEEQNEKNK